MKPKNAREKEVLALSRRLPDINKAKIDWIKDRIVEKRIYTSGKSCWCSKCGKWWKESIKGDTATCPACGCTGEVVRSRKQKGSGVEYAQFLQTFGGYQIIRYVVVEWYFRKGMEQRIFFRDVLQKWCQPGRPTVTLGASLVSYPWSCRIPYSI